MDRMQNTIPLLLYALLRAQSSAQTAQKTIPLLLFTGCCLITAIAQLFRGRCLAAALHATLLPPEGYLCRIPYRRAAICLPRTVLVMFVTGLAFLPRGLVLTLTILQLFQLFPP
jgi:hypothetical protein